MSATDTRPAETRGTAVRAGSAHRIRAQYGIAFAAALTLAGCNSAGVGPNAVAGKTPDGTIEIHSAQVAYIGSGQAGSGTLFYRGASYPFTVGGLGVGGIGASTIDAQGEVYNLPSIGYFPGNYAQARYGFAVGQFSRGDLWLQNDNGVILHMKAKRTGLILSLGGDAMVLTLK